MAEGDEEEYPYPSRLLEDPFDIYHALSSYLTARYNTVVDDPGIIVTDVDRRVLAKNRFWSPTIPQISFSHYIRRFQGTMPNIETNVLLAIPIYADRLVKRRGRDMTSGLTLGLNILHRFAITAVCLASKALGDQYYSNAYCAVVGGVSTRELDGMELELAARLEWELQCAPSEYAWSWSQLRTIKK